MENEYNFNRGLLCSLGVNSPNCRKFNGMTLSWLFILFIVIILIIYLFSSCNCKK